MQLHTPASITDSTGVNEDYAARVGSRPSIGKLLMLWSSVEANVLVTVSCLPTIGPFIRFLIAKTMPSKLTSKKGTGYPTYPASSEYDRYGTGTGGTGGKKKFSTLDGSTTFGCDVDVCSPSYLILTFITDSSAGNTSRGSRTRDGCHEFKQHALDALGRR